MKGKPLGSFDPLIVEYMNRPDELRSMRFEDWLRDRDHRADEASRARRERVKTIAERAVLAALVAGVLVAGGCEYRAAAATGNGELVPPVAPEPPPTLPPDPDPPLPKIAGASFVTPLEVRVWRQARRDQITPAMRSSARLILSRVMIDNIRTTRTLTRCAAGVNWYRWPRRWTCVTTGGKWKIITRVQVIRRRPIVVTTMRVLYRGKVVATNRSA